GGPGVTGPVIWWFDDFSTQSQTSWTILPSGKLLLGVSTISHTINSSMGGCHYAFPADMDGDGDVDVLSSHAQTAGVCGADWFENDGNGSGWDIHHISGDYYIKCAYPGDMDNDGDIDVVGVRPIASTGYVYWWRNDDGLGDSWTWFTIDDDYGAPLFVCCADINGDDTLEVIAPEGNNLTHIAWWESSTTPPDSVWEKHVLSSSSRSGRELFPVDLDQDGDVDIASACHWFDGLSWWENTDGVGLSWTEHSIGNETGVRSVHAADIDGDGDYDVVCATMEEKQVSWFENLDGSCTSWEEHILITNCEWPRGVHAADVTDDGFVDILVAVYEDNQLFLYMNMDGTGMEWAVYLLKSGWWFEDVDVADFNNDGFIDILAGAVLGAEVSWHEISGYSSGWLESSILDVGGYPEWDSIGWTAEEPAGTDLFFQIKSSNDWEDMGAWCDTIFEPGSLAGLIDSTHRYIQYRVGMTTESRFGTPVLDEVRFYWSSMGIEVGSGGEEFVITAVPNPSAGGVSIIVPSLYAEDVELFVYDLSGKVVRILAERNGSTFIWDGRDSSGHEAPTGTYIIRGVVEGRSAAVRFVKL
ncbi:MAG: hypothetical protein DRP42_07710, partial [Tenericutes bacterium]